MDKELRDCGWAGGEPAQRRPAVQRGWPIARAVLYVTEVVAAACNDESLCLAAQALVVFGDMVLRA
jgi:hypothetical protein